MTWFKSLPWYFQIGAIVIILALVVLVWEKGGTAYAHYKWGKSDQQVTETLNKSNDLEKQSAELKAQADQFEKLAAAKNAQIDALTEQSKKYGAQAAASVDAINQSYAQLEKANHSKFN
jgi:FlaG/FlaF family flagellin (archaellin)